ncbi:MAG: peptidylprolyl isomerase [Bacteroidia bacterium]|nr:peptidylprolyl isomerase [Bacteroidia bacterium]
MKIDKNTVVSLHYTLKNKEGKVLDTSLNGEPLVYLHGVGGLIPGLEEELLGKEKGASFNAVIPPEKAYGVYNEAYVKKVSKSMFQGTEELNLGMQVQMQSQSGETAMAVISKIEGDDIFLDLNPPLAGETLYFDVDVVSVRAASESEIEHGHAHGPGGHEH